MLALLCDQCATSADARGLGQRVERSMDPDQPAPRRSACCLPWLDGSCAGHGTSSSRCLVESPGRPGRAPARLLRLVRVLGWVLGGRVGCPQLPNSASRSQFCGPGHRRPTAWSPRRGRWVCRTAAHRRRMFGRGSLITSHRLRRRPVRAAGARRRGNCSARSLFRPAAHTHASRIRKL